MSRLPLLFFISCLLAPWAGADPAADARSQLRALLEEHWAHAEAEQVFFRTDPDAFRPHGKLPDWSPEARARRHAFNERMLQRLEAIDAAALDGQDAISLKLFRYERETERDSFSQHDHLFPLTSLFGYHSYFANAPANMDFDSSADYDRYLVTLEDFPRYNRDQIAALSEGIASGFTQYCGAMSGYAEGIAALIVDEPESSSLYAPFREFPATVPEPGQADLRARGRALVANAVIPAYRELYDFYTRQYLPNCRRQVGITGVEGGAAYYAWLLRYFTTTDMTAADIHELGLRETARIRGEMEAIIRHTGFDGSFAEFLVFLRTSPRFYAGSPRELLEKTAFAAKQADGMMPRFFGRLARNTYEIRDAPGRDAYYVSGPADGRSPGIYFVNANSYGSRPLYNIEALTLHEAVPGHHHQSALALELDLPEFRKTVYHAAFGEGWGLYAESLGKEMGFYTDPYSDFGRLTYEMWRANRLVVDTGLHAFGWSRQQAIDYLLENTALTEPEVVPEVDRYITWPGQATAYKIGELRIQALRTRAEMALGPDFDLRAFHDVVVGNGSLAIAILEEIVEGWIASQLRAQDAAL
ncbi:MAG: DUF885 domain-containing protein [Haliea sp.]|uniref:DUF885 domain-containing protein n=1 Tax=Haliea sp. TaxID=1932666 RepID=UPI0032EE150F